RTRTDGNVRRRKWKRVGSSEQRVLGRQAVELEAARFGDDLGRIRKRRPKCRRGLGRQLLEELHRLLAHAPRSPGGAHWTPIGGDPPRAALDAEFVGLRGAPQQTDG